ncbi:hypothetical protein HZA26_00285 [Candidatus Nomurabacteria bacterium]|nr:hypothetical protein [Candidatus Nomurabacteria bacterium]
MVNYVRFYPDSALERAGAYVNRGDKWSNKTVKHKELITGQNPFSHNDFAKLLVSALSEQKK